MSIEYYLVRFDYGEDETRSTVRDIRAGRSLMLLLGFQ